MNNLNNQSYWHPGKRPSSTLVEGVRFVLGTGGRATFVAWQGYPVPGRQGSYRTGVVRTVSGTKTIRFHMAGSVSLA